MSNYRPQRPSKNDGGLPRIRVSKRVPDEVLDMVKEIPGIVMDTFVPSFVSEELRQYFAEARAQQAKLEALYIGQPDRVRQEMSQWRDANPEPSATLEQVADHIDHIRDRIGVEYIGIGADYDGITSLPAGLEDASTYPDLFAELLRRGYSGEDLKKIAGLNILRVMREAEDVAERLQQERPSSEAVIDDF
jgi:membrane dipeptidase